MVAKLDYEPPRPAVRRSPTRRMLVAWVPFCLAAAFTGGALAALPFWVTRNADGAWGVIWPRALIIGGITAVVLASLLWDGGMSPRATFATALTVGVTATLLVTFFAFAGR